MQGENGLKGVQHPGSPAAAERGCGAILLAATSVQGDKLEVAEVAGEESAGLTLPNSSSKSIHLFFVLFCYNTY